MEENMLSVLSPHVHPSRSIERAKLTKHELEMAHYCVLENCQEAKYYLGKHKEKFDVEFPNHTDDARIKHFIKYFHIWMTQLEGCSEYNDQLYNLSCEPQSHNFYSHCEVNGVKFIIWERDCNLRTQNSGVMVETDDEKYYGALEDVVELIYPHGVSVVLFKCRWFNEGRWNIKKDHGLESLDTSVTWYEDTPYCLASVARQVFYIDDPKCGGNWKVVNVVDHRGTYKDRSLALNPTSSLLTTDDIAYQESAPSNIPFVSIESYLFDFQTQARPSLNVQNDLDDEEEVVDDDDDDDDDDDNDDDDNDDYA